MKKYFALLLIPAAVYGQQVTQNPLRSNSMFMVDVTGIPFQTKDVSYVSGTPFNKDVWQKGTAVYRDGKRTTRFVGKLNLLQNQLHYLNSAGVEYIAEPLLKEMILVDSVAGTAPIHFVLLPDLESTGRGKDIWYQVLDSGRIQLYSVLRKKQSEEKPYGSATTEFRIVDTEVFYLMQENGSRQIRSVKDLLEALPDRRAELESFVGSMDNKRQPLAKRLTAVVHHYNSLFAPNK